MKILSWNLNHRAARRPIPSWITSAIARHAPDTLVLTEYVEGQDHHQFLLGLGDLGLRNVLISPRTLKENQVLIASRDPMRSGGLKAPPLHPSVPPNALHALLGNARFNLLGFRMPAFTGQPKAIKRETWNWLLDAAAGMLSTPAAIVGDFNTTPGDIAANCGDCLDALVSQRWQHMRPTSGFSWRHLHRVNAAN